MIALVFVAALCQQEFEYRQGTGVVELATGQARSPEDFLKFALAEREAGRTQTAVSALTVLATRVPDAGIRENAHFERATTFYKSGAYYEAYHDFEAFILKFPQSERVTTAKRMEMTSSLELAKVGKSTWLGLGTTYTTGVEYLHDALRRYPHEDFAPDFLQKLGMFFYERTEFDRAAEEFGRVLEQYAESPEAVLALYMMGRTSEVRFDALDYDWKPLKDARRHYERFLEETDRMRRLSDQAKRWVDALLPAVRERLGSVYDRMLAKQLKTAEYYDWKSLPWSAEPFYLSILRDEVSFRKALPGYPETKAVKKARARLTELSKK
ncbi:MAG TPA: outer membrane protein assembly factor BamD [Planctomycetota bacterium]|nr:outer membrane protein assembly factor BamD [Planctomycetota bacterium]